MATRKVVGGILLAGDQLLCGQTIKPRSQPGQGCLQERRISQPKIVMRTWVEQLAVCAGPDLVNDSRLQKRDLKVSTDPAFMVERSAKLGGKQVAACSRPEGRGGGRGSHLQIQEHAARHVLAGTRLGEERVERIVTATDRLVGGHLSIGLNAVLQAIQLPASIADLRNSR